jgi:hypothetical protein
MEGETQPKLSKRLQIVTLCPLLSGILICTIIIIAILFSNYLDWIKKTTDFIKNSEYENLEKLSTASSDLIASKLKQMVFEMNMLDEMFNSQIDLVDNGNKFITTENLYNANVGKT